MIAIAVAPIAAPIRTRRRVASGIAATTGDCGWKSSTPKAHAEIMKNPKPTASIRYSGQCSLNVFSMTLDASAGLNHLGDKIYSRTRGAPRARLPPRDEPLLDEQPPLPDSRFLSA